MAHVSLQKFRISRRTGPLDAERLVFAYNALADTLLVHLTGEARPAVTVEMGHAVQARVDPETGELVGFQIDAYLTRAVHELPPLLELAPLVGSDEATIATIRARIDPRQTKQAVVSALFERAFAHHSPLALSWG